MKAVHTVKPPSTLRNELWPVVPNISQAGLSTTIVFDFQISGMQPVKCCRASENSRFRHQIDENSYAFRKEEAVSNIIKIKLQFNLFYARH